MAIAPAIGDLGFRRPLLATAIAAGTVLALDQGSKAWFRANVDEWERGPQLGPIRTKRVEHDAGVANGINSGEVRHMAIAGSVVTVGAVGTTLVSAYVPRSWAPAAIAAGAIGGTMLGAMLGNTVEMGVRGSVTDFIYVDLPDRMDSAYAIANVADVAIGAAYIGMGTLALGGVGFGLVRGARALARTL